MTHTMTTDEVRWALRRQAAGHGGRARMARASGVSASYVTRVLDGKVAAIPPRMAHLLGLRPVTRYVEVNTDG